jgi:anti-sigma-K factor RskA
MADDPVQDLAAAYVLGALEPHEQAAAEERLAADAAFRAAVDEARAVAELLPLAAPALTPPLDVRQRLFMRLNQAAPVTNPVPTGAGGALPPVRRGWFRWWQPLLVAAAGLALALLVGSLGMVRQELQTQSAQVERLTPKATQAAEVVTMMFSPAATAVPLRPPAPQPAPEGRLLIDHYQGRALLLVRQLPPAPPRQAYQVWLAAAREARPTPAGTFRVDGDGVGILPLPLPGSWAEIRRLWVTVEPEEGSAEPTGQPVLDVSF